MIAVASFVLTEAYTIEVVAHIELVTTRDVAHAAKFTVPDGLFIVCAPVVPVAVFVASNVSFPA